MKIIAEIEIPDSEFRLHVKESIMAFYRINNWRDLKLDPKEEAKIYSDAKDLFVETFQSLMDDWDNYLDGVTLTLYLETNCEPFAQRLRALQEKGITAEQKQALEERIQSATRFLEKHGHTVKRGSKKA